MITASFKRDKDRQCICMTLRGHARQDNPGKDIVCASASILAYTLAQTLKYIQSQGGIHKLRIKIDSGDAKITCYPTEEFYDVVLHTYLTTEVGISLLEHNFPEYVELSMFAEG